MTRSISSFDMSASNGGMEVLGMPLMRVRLRSSRVGLLSGPVPAVEVNLKMPWR